MGQRANLIIIEKREYALYYSHWCANTITRDLFWGPTYAIDFVRAQRAVDESGWLDNVWAEGGTVIDCDRRLLLLYGGEELRHVVPLRRVYLEMLGRVWQGWEIRWAHEGIAEIADYVGYPRNKVISTKQDLDSSIFVLSASQQQEWTDLVGSFRTADNRLLLFPLVGNVESYLFAGPSLELECHRSDPPARVPLDEWIKDGFPTGGFHVDVLAKRVDYWTARDIPDVPRRVSEIWRGWDVTWHRDEYEFQVDATTGSVQFPARFRETLQQQLKEMLLHEYGRSRAESIREIADKCRPEGTKDVQINPWALRDDRLELDVIERQRIVAVALDSDEGG